MSVMPDRSPLPTLRDIHDALLTAYGEQAWWPGETPFEVMVGAILTQNTAWTNVEKGIAALIAADALDAGAIVAMDPATLGSLLRPVGYFNVKARRLQNLCRWYLESGGETALAAVPTSELRNELLVVNGVGPETADDILLYALQRPVFVIDAYTRRLFGRLGLIDPQAGYEALRQCFESALGADTALYNEYHALIVIHAKGCCRPKPRCGDCPLNERCPAAA
jgi:endonuclease-3 related protein